LRRCRSTITASSAASSCLSSSAPARRCSRSFHGGQRIHGPLRAIGGTTSLWAISSGDVSCRYLETTES
jgi:hypothetical protein